jgi:hypothetical protein
VHGATAEREKIARKIMKQNGAIDTEELAGEENFPVAVDAAQAD